MTRARYALLLAAAVIVQVVLWMALLDHNLTRAAAVLESLPDQAQRNLAVLSSDTLEYRDYYRAFPARLDELTLQGTFVEYYKRPLYGPVSAFANAIAAQWLGLAFPARMYLVLALYATTATMLMAGLARLVGLPPRTSALLAAICTASFGWAAIFSIPESYSLSVCGALLAAVSGQLLPQLRTPGATVAALGHALVAGLAAWLYLPALGAVFLIASRIERPRQWLTVATPALILAVGVAVLPHVYWGPSSLQHQIEYGDRWTSARHLAEPATIAGVGAALLVFTAIAPVDDFVDAAPAVDVTVMARRWPVAGGGLLLLTLYAILAWAAASRGAGARLRGPLLWLASLYAFHLLFNPGEVLLYLAVPTAVLGYLVAIALHAAGPGRRVDLVLASVLLLLLACNAGAVLG